MDVLVNNAGIALTGFFEDTSSAEIRKVFETNVFGLAAMTKAVLPMMRRQKKAMIINISSIAGILGKPILSVYSASKWAVSGLSQSLNYELEPIGIRVVNVCPGIFKTNLIKKNTNLVQNAQDSKISLLQSNSEFSKCRSKGDLYGR